MVLMGGGGNGIFEDNSRNRLIGNMENYRSPDDPRVEEGRTFNLKAFSSTVSSIDWITTELLNFEIQPRISAKNGGAE